MSPPPRGQACASARPRSGQLTAWAFRDAAEDLLAFTSFPVPHWKTWSTNPLERLNKEIERRTDVVAVFPNPEALGRLAGAVPVGAHNGRSATAATSPKAP